MKTTKQQKGSPTEVDRQRIQAEITKFEARRKKIRFGRAKREAEARARYPVGTRVRITSRYHTNPVCLQILHVEPNRGVPYQEDFCLSGIDLDGGYPRSVAVSKAHRTRVEVLD